MIEFHLYSTNYDFYTLLHLLMAKVRSASLHERIRKTKKMSSNTSQTATLRKAKIFRLAKPQYIYIMCTKFMMVFVCAKITRTTRCAQFTKTKQPNQKIYDSRGTKGMRANQQQQASTAFINQTNLPSVTIAIEINK